MPVEAALHRLPFFSQLSNDEVQEFARLGEVVAMSAGDIVCREGELSDSMYLLLAGSVSVYRHDHAGRQVEMRQFEAGDYFGEVALLDSRPRTATAACLTDCQLFVLRQAVFRDVLSANPSLVLRVLGALADRSREQIEERYQAELANLTLEARAELERHRSLAQMVAGVAHELNTPLGITNTAVDMIANRLTRPEIVALFEASDQTRRLFDNIQEATSLAQRNIVRAHKLIQDFKKISVNQLIDAPQTEDLSELVASTIALFTLNARQAKLTIEICNRLPTGNSDWFGYPGHLTQVLLNLLTNIVSYAYEPGVGGRVDILLAATETRHVPTFTITVTDYGRGIPPENLDKLFEPFFTTGRSKGGTGLGLSIVRNIVTAVLQGEITIDSTPSQGATFQITFPREISDAEQQLADFAR